MVGDSERGADAGWFGDGRGESGPASGPAAHRRQRAARRRDVLQEVCHLLLLLVLWPGPEVVKQHRGDDQEDGQRAGGEDGCNARHEAEAAGDEHHPAPDDTDPRERQALRLRVARHRVDVLEVVDPRERQYAAEQYPCDQTDLCCDHITVQGRDALERSRTDASPGDSGVTGVVVIAGSYPNH